MLWIKLLAVLLFWALPVVAQQPAEVATEAEQAPQTPVPQPDKEAQAAFDILMAAIEANDFAGFVAVGDAAFQAALTRQAFEQLAAQIAPRMKKGYETTFFGEMKQQGYQVYLWKTTFQDEGDDLLIKLAMKDGKVSGFFFV